MNFEALHNIGTNSNPLDNLIESYVVSADGNLNVGDLCEFINGQVRKTWLSTGVSTLTQISSIAQYVTCVSLDSTHAVLTYANSSTCFIYAMVLTLSGSNINIGILYQVTSVAVGNTITTALDSSRVLVTYGGAAYGFSVVLTISGTTISVGTITQITNVVSSPFSSIQLDSSRVLVTYQNLSVSGYQWGVVLTIIGTTISAGTLTYIAGRPNASSATLIDSSHIGIAYTDYTSNTAMTVVISISGSTITAGAFIGIGTSGGYYITATYIDTNRYLVTYANGALFSVIITFTPALVVTVGTITQIINISPSYIQSVKLDATHLFISYVNNTTGNYLWCVVITIASSTIIVGTPYQINSVSSNTSSIPLLLDATHVLLIYASTGQTTWGVIVGLIGNVPTSTVVSHVLIPNVLCLTPTTVGNNSKFGVKGIFGGFTGLIPGTTYYSDNNGNLTTAITTIKIGVALSSTELLIKKAFWER